MDPKEILQMLLAAFPPAKVFNDHMLKLVEDIKLEKYESHFGFMLSNQLKEGKEQLVMEIVTINFEKNISRVVKTIVAEEIIQTYFNS